MVIELTLPIVKPFNVTGAEVANPATFSYTTYNLLLESNKFFPFKKLYPHRNINIDIITNTAVLISLDIFKIEYFKQN
jgi:hypothetical protein